MVVGIPLEGCPSFRPSCQWQRAAAARRPVLALRPALSPDIGNMLTSVTVRPSLGVESLTSPTKHTNNASQPHCRGLSTINYPSVKREPANRAPASVGDLFEVSDNSILTLHLQVLHGST